jgi:hypothetical protein
MHDGLRWYVRVTESIMMAIARGLDTFMGILSVSSFPMGYLFRSLLRWGCRPIPEVMLLLPLVSIYLLLKNNRTVIDGTGPDDVMNGFFLYSISLDLSEHGRTLVLPRNQILRLQATLTERNKVTEDIGQEYYSRHL